jgi:hypothetical protein
MSPRVRGAFQCILLVAFIVIASLMSFEFYMFFCLMFTDKTPMGWILGAWMFIWAVNKRFSDGPKQGIDTMTKKQLRGVIRDLNESMGVAEKEIRRLNAQVNVLERKLKKLG